MGPDAPWLGLAMWLVFIAAIGVAVWALLRPGTGCTSSPPCRGPPGDSAMAILRAQFAHGEIDGDEFMLKPSTSKVARLRHHLRRPRNRRCRLVT